MERARQSGVRGDAMRRQRMMSSKQRRVAGAWLTYYAKLDKLPQVGCIRFGGGLDTLRAVQSAKDAGYYVKVQTATYATLHRA